MSTANLPEKRRRSGCPVCGKTPSGTHTPFCSQGCRDRDLLKWLGEGYRMPGPSVEESGPEGLDSEG